MATPKASRTPIDQKPAATGDYVQTRKNEAIRSEIAREPNISARQIAENLHRKGMDVSMSHIYRQLSNFANRTQRDKSRPWTGTNIGLPAPAGFSASNAKSYLDKPEEYGGMQRGKEITETLGEVDEAIERGNRDAEPSSSRAERTSRAKGTKMSRH
jgi:hypothetical protein